MAFAATLRAVVLWTPLLSVWPSVQLGAVLASITAVHVTALIFLTVVLIVLQLSSHNVAELVHTGVKQMAFVMQYVLEQSYERSVRPVVGWSRSSGRTISSIAGILAPFGSSTLLQLGGTLLARGAVCMQAAGLSSWPGRPPGSAEHAAAPALAPVTARAAAGQLNANCKPILHRCTPRHRQRATTGRRCSLVIATLIAGVALATWARSGASMQAECDVVSRVVGQPQAPTPVPRRGPRGMGLGARRIYHQPPLRVQGALLTHHAQPACVSRHRKQSGGSKPSGANPARWLLTGGASEVAIEGNRGLWLRSRPQPSALVPFQLPAQLPMPTLLADFLNLLAMCACIANQAAIAAAETEAVAVWSGWQPPLPLLTRLRTAGVGSRAPFAAPPESARAMERRTLAAQARLRVAAACTLQLVLISFSLAPLFYYAILLEAYYTLLLTYAALAAGVICCMLCTLRVAVSSAMWLMGRLRRGLLRSMRELTRPEVLGVILLEVSAACTLTLGPVAELLVMSSLTLVRSAVTMTLMLVGALSIASVAAVALGIGRTGRAALASLAVLGAPIARGASRVCQVAAPHQVPGWGFAVALVDLARSIIALAWWTTARAVVAGRRAAASAATAAASAVPLGRIGRCRWAARPTVVSLLVAVSPLMLAALAVALLVRCGDDVGTACMRSASWPPDRPAPQLRTPPCAR